MLVLLVYETCMRVMHDKQVMDDDEEEEYFYTGGPVFFVGSTSEDLKICQCQLPPGPTWTLQT